MKNLAIMVSNIKRQNVKSNIFPVRYNNYDFSCILLLQDYGCTLLITTLGENPDTISIDFNDKFETPSILNYDEYLVIANYLGFTGKNGKVFHPNAFFNEFDSHIDPRFRKEATNKQRTRAIGRAVSIKEEDKIFFCGWKNNGTSGNVSDRNYQKTRKLVGDSVARKLRNLNISSKWTNNEEKENLRKLNQYT